MNLGSILDELRNQRSQLDQAIAALQGTASTRGPAITGSVKRRHMSAAARARIGAAKKAWWAKQKRNFGGSRKSTSIHRAKRDRSTKEGLDVNESQVDREQEGCLSSG